MMDLAEIKERNKLACGPTTAQVDWLLSEVERLNNQNTAVVGSCETILRQNWDIRERARTAESRAEKAEAERDRYRKALEKHGWHVGDCNRRMRQFNEPCKCGFEAALSAKEGEK
jgi:hypothetical protein